jgi:transcriptional regulator with XRE-family HTH domain
MAKRKEANVPAFMAKHIDEVGKTQKQIARECGCPKPNVITMIKQGHMKVPLEKIGPLAKSLEVDPAVLFWLCMSEYAGETLKALVLATPGVVLAPNEREILKAYRGLVGNDTNRTITISDGSEAVRVAPSPS